MSPQRQLELLKIRKAQATDSLVRTATTALLSLILVGAVIFQAIESHPGERLSGIGAVLVGWAGVVVGFYFGGHVATNTSNQEDHRLSIATESAEESARKALASAIAVEIAAMKIKP